MTFFVFEPDQLVREDICEALAAEFGADVVVVVDTLDACVAQAEAARNASTAVLSLTGEQLGQSMESVSALLESVKVVIIGNRPPKDELFSLPISFVQRPFSSEQLISVIRDA